MHRWREEERERERDERWRREREREKEREGGERVREVKRKNAKESTLLKFGGGSKNTPRNVLFQTTASCTP